MRNIFLAILFLSVVSYGQSRIIFKSGTGEIINKNIYGHFSEHLGRCIYDGFYVGDTNKIIPNTRGIRNDIVAALKKMKIPLLRWPGGCFADTYHWKDGIGPKESRPTIVNTWWGGVTENNSFGTNEFLDLCEQLHAEPFISGNVGSGTPQELSDWVQYVNFHGISPMSNLRIHTGREKPWNVKYWGIGNEAWGCGGNMRVEYYVDIYRKFATFMTNTPEVKLFRIASGPSDDNYYWTEVLMRDIPHHLLEGIGLHHYSVIDWNKKSSATDFTEGEYFATMKQAVKMDEIIVKHSQIMDKYDPGKKVALAVDEWGGWYDVDPGTNPAFLFQQNTMRDAILAGVTLNIFNNHCGRVKMANLAQTVNVLQAVILTEKEKIILTPTYHVFEMYNVHQDAVLIPLEINSSDYVFENEKLNAVSCSASQDKNDKIHVSLVNLDINNSNKVSLDMTGFAANKITGRILTSERVQDHNTFQNPDKITPDVFNNFSMKESVLNLELPKCSIVVLEIQ